MKYLLLISITVFLTSCGGIKSTPSTVPNELTDECRYKEQVCQDALEFQQEYTRMPQEQQQEMTAVLNSLIEQCERTREMCKDSQK